MCASLFVRAGWRAVVAGFLTLLSLLAGVGLAPASEPWPSARLSTGETEERILEALDAKTSVQFVETPLTDVLTTLERQHDIEIELDNKALDIAGVGSETPISRVLNNVSLRSALGLMFDAHGLSYIVRNEVLLITSIESARNHPEVRMYDVAELLQDDETAHSVARLLQHAFGPWPAPRTARSMAGRRGAAGGRPGAPGARGRMGRGGAAGPGRSARPIPTGPRRFYAHRHVLIVHDTLRGHQEVASYLTALGEALEDEMYEEDEEEDEPEEEETDDE